MAKVVSVIPASSRAVNTQNETEKRELKRVAAYARVSTDMKEQLNSFDAQVRYYTEYIQKHEDWSFVKVYSDEGISGTSTAKREGFKQMIKDALDGEIDLILTKSISRFARNTVDSLTTIRQLKESDVEVYFEKENLWTKDNKSEMILTIMSSIAQEESRSLSENCKWGIRKRFAEGKVTMTFSSILGYKRGPDGEIIIDEDEAKVIKYIYKQFLLGKTTSLIATELTKNKIVGLKGRTQWSTGHIQSILTNEKYTGNAILQKTYIADYLTKKVCVNNGELPKYYVRASHPAIICEEIFALVQEKMKTNKPDKSTATQRNASAKYTFSNMIKCKNCGSNFVRRTWNGKTPSPLIVWQCGARYRKPDCKAPHIHDVEIKEIVLEEIENVLSRKEEVLAELQARLKSIGNVGKKINTLMSNPEKNKNKIEKYTKQLAFKGEIMDVTSHLKKINLPLVKLTDTIVRGLIDHIDINYEGDVEINFRGGIE